MDTELTVQLHLRIALQIQLPIEVIGSEGNLPVLAALENVFVLRLSRAPLPLSPLVASITNSPMAFRLQDRFAFRRASS